MHSFIIRERTARYDKLAERRLQMLLHTIILTCILSSFLLMSAQRRLTIHSGEHVDYLMKHLNITRLRWFLAPSIPDSHSS